MMTRINIYFNDKPKFAGNKSYLEAVGGNLKPSRAE